ncbi:MAG: hypothetical protein IMF17_03535, partial [Proteobacteria bacterium]|nr:hypothetical protein [Pseudomonadota bacterium]
MSAVQQTISGSKRLIVVGILLALFIILMLASLVYVGDKRASLQRHVELSADQLLMSQQMATYSLSASSGSEVAFDRLLNARIKFDTILNSYRTGDQITARLSDDLLLELDTV